MQQLSKSPQLNHKKSGDISIYFHSDSSTLEDSLDIIASKIAEIKSEHIKSSNYPDTIINLKSTDKSNIPTIKNFTMKRKVRVYVWKEKSSPHRRALLLHHGSTGLLYVHNCGLSANGNHKQDKREEVLVRLIDSATKSNSNHPLNLFFQRVEEVEKKKLELGLLETKKSPTSGQGLSMPQKKKPLEQEGFKKLNRQEQVANNLIQYLLQDQSMTSPKGASSENDVVDQGIKLLKAILPKQKAELSTIEITFSRKKSTVTVSHYDGSSTKNITVTLPEVDMGKINGEDWINEQLHTLANTYYELEPSESSWLLARSTEIPTKIYSELIERELATQQRFIEKMKKMKAYGCLSEILQSCLNDLNDSARANQNDPLALIQIIVKQLPQHFMREIKTDQRLLKHLPANNILKIIQAIAEHEHVQDDIYDLFFSALSEKMRDNKEETRALLKQHIQKKDVVPEVKAVSLTILQMHEDENQDFKETFESLAETHTLPRSIYIRGEALFPRKEKSSIPARQVVMKGKKLKSGGPHKTRTIKISFIDLLRRLFQPKVEILPVTEKKATKKKTKKMAKSSQISLRKLLQEARRDEVCKTTLSRLSAKPESADITNPLLAFKECMDANQSEHLSGHDRGIIKRAEEALLKLTDKYETKISEKNTICIFDEEIADEYQKNRHIIDTISEKDRKSLTIFYDSLEQLYPVKKMAEKKSSGVEIDKQSLIEYYSIDDETPHISKYRSNYENSCMICELIQMIPADGFVLNSLELTKNDKILLENIRAYGQLNPNLHRELRLRGLEKSAIFAPKWQQVSEDITQLINIKLHHQANLPETSTETRRQMQDLIEKNIKQYSENIIAMHERNPIDGTRYHMVSTDVIQEEAQKLNSVLLKAQRHTELSKTAKEVALQAIEISVRELRNQLVEKPTSLESKIEFVEKEAENIIAKAIEESKKFAASISPQEHKKELSSVIQHIAENNYQPEGSSVNQERGHALEMASIEEQIAAIRQEKIKALKSLQKNEISKKDSYDLMESTRARHKDLCIKRYQKTLLSNIVDALEHVLIPELKPLIICTIAKKYFAQDRNPLTEEQRIQITIDMLVGNQFGGSDLSEAGLLKAAHQLALCHRNQEKSSHSTDAKDQTSKDEKREAISTQDETNAPLLSPEESDFSLLGADTLFSQSKESQSQSARPKEEFMP